MQALYADNIFSLLFISSGPWKKKKKQNICEQESQEGDALVTELPEYGSSRECCVTLASCVQTPCMHSAHMHITVFNRYFAFTVQLRFGTCRKNTEIELCWEEPAERCGVATLLGRVQRWKQLIDEERLFCILAFKAQEGKDSGRERARLKGRGWLVKAQPRNISEGAARQAKADGLESKEKPQQLCSMKFGELR